jgi:hypothetical protein
VAEIWLPVVGYEGYYEVSDCGNVRSLDRVVTCTDLLNSTPRQRQWIMKGRVLKASLTSPTRRGVYRKVQLSRDGEDHQYLVYVLVARAFLGPLPEGMQTRHGAAGKLEDSVWNLSYGTHGENQHDRARDQTDNAGTRNGQAKLTEQIVRECRARNAAGESKAALAREFGVSRQGMRMAINGDNWRHVSAA